MIENVRCINILDMLRIPSDSYLITGSAWLSVMGIRENKDIDIILSKDARKNFDQYIKNIMADDIRNNLSVYIDKSIKHENRHVNIASVGNVDILIARHKVTIDGYPFVSFSVFKEYKKSRKRDSDKKDWSGIKDFFKKNMHLMPKFSGVFD